MQLIEFDGKALLARHGLDLLPRRLLAPEDDIAAPSWMGDSVVKAQVFAGGRGKAGLVRKAAPSELEATVDSIRALLRARGKPAWVMLEQACTVVTEHYMALVIDDVRRAPCLLYSPHGGIEVESRPDEVQRLLIDPLHGLTSWHVIQFLRAAGLDAAWLGAGSRFAMALWRVYCAEEAEMIEINPLAITADKKMIALDAKVVLDDHATARHRQRGELASGRIDLEENGPKKSGATDTYVEMDGDIGMLTGGAGLGMATLDMLADAGLRAATFVDGAGGGSDDLYAQKAHLVLNRSKDPAIKGVLIYFTLAAASLAPIARGTLQALRDNPIGKPIVVGIVAAAAAEAEMSAAAARAAFIEAGFPFHAELDDAIATLAQLVHGKGPAG